MEYYWKKKTITSFVLAILVTLIHLDVSSKYLDVANGTGWGGVEVVRWLEFFFHEGIGVVAVPLFFVISGATFFRNYHKGDYGKKLKTRLKSIAVPYFVWNILTSLCYIVIWSTSLRYALGAEHEFMLTPDYLFKAIVLHDRIKAFWFIYNLMVFILLTLLFDFFLQKKWTTIVFALFLLSLPMYATDAMKPSGLWAIAPIYYFAGCIIGKYRFEEFAKERCKFSWGSLIGTVLCTVVLLINASDDIITMPVVLRQIIVVAFTLFFWRLLDTLCHQVQEHGYMNHNFIIYAFHPFMQALIMKPFLILFPKTGWVALITYITTGVMTIVLIAWMSEILKIKTPKIYYLLSGGR